MDGTGVEQEQATVTAESSAASRPAGVKARKIRSRYRVTSSGIVKDVAVGGVALVAIKVTYMYLKVFGQRPELLAEMGPKLILDILAIAIVGVIVNRGVDIFAGALDRTADSLDRALNRMADSSERTAQSAAKGALAQQDTAQAQREIALSQQALATAQRDQTAVMERVAANGDSTMTQVQTLQNYQVSQGKMMMRRQRRIEVMLDASLKHMGVTTPADVDEEDKDHA